MARRWHGRLASCTAPWCGESGGQHLQMVVITSVTHERSSSEVFTKRLESPIVQLHAEYCILMELFAQLVESQAGGNIETGNEWLNDAQILSEKLYKHLASMYRLAQEAPINIRGAPLATHIDHASVQVVARAGLETYLVFFYIYGTNDESLSLFRHKTWHLAGLMDRQKYTIISEESGEEMRYERDVIRRLKDEITQSAHTECLSRAQRRQLLKGNWRVGKSWRDIGKMADFHERFFESVYNYLCGYSHSSYASALQVRTARSLEDQRMLTQGTIGLGLVLMAHFSFTYPSLFPSASAALSSNQEARRLAENFRFGREDMVSIYGA